VIKLTEGVYERVISLLKGIVVVLSDFCCAAVSCDVSEVVTHFHFVLHKCALRWKSCHIQKCVKLFIIGIYWEMKYNEVNKYTI